MSIKAETVARQEGEEVFVPFSKEKQCCSLVVGGYGGLTRSRKGMAGLSVGLSWQLLHVERWIGQW